MVAIIETTTLVPYHSIKSLQLIWRSATRRFHLRVPHLQLSSSDLTMMRGYQITIPTTHQCPIPSNVPLFSRFWNWDLSLPSECYPTWYSESVVHSLGVLLPTNMLGSPTSSNQLSTGCHRNRKLASHCTNNGSIMHGYLQILCI